jgi:hypothetical protein
VSYVDRFIVAIAKLGGPIEVEAKALATDLGNTAYETKLKLTAGLPAIVLSTTDGEAATALGAKLRARGNRALVVRSSSVIAASAMVRVRQFDLDEDGINTEVDQLPWSDISALVRARNRSQHDTTEVVKEKKFDLGRAVASGGLVLRSIQKREVVTHHESSEQVLYMFRASGDTPWLLREQGTNFRGLGGAQQATANLNFGLACDRFKARATSARYDDSLLHRPAINEVDLYAYLISLGA